MIPERIERYLSNQGIAVERIGHPRAVSAQELAQSLHTSGHQVAKSLLVMADGKPWLAVLAASDRLDPILIGGVLGARHVELASEAMLAEIFPDCEVGAEPPFGRLYGVPVVLDADLTREAEWVVRAGSHEEALRIAYDDYTELENPKVGAFAVTPELELTLQAESHP
jgi:Ala-tRNA(Pro) deacylase